jgi:hypothetical protein
MFDAPSVAHPTDGGDARRRAAREASRDDLHGTRVPDAIRQYDPSMFANPALTRAPAPAPPIKEESPWRLRRPEPLREIVQHLDRSRGAATPPRPESVYPLDDRRSRPPSRA